MIRDPKTDPIPAPDPATPTVAAPAPMNLAAESMSCLAEEVWMRAEVAGLAVFLHAAIARRGETERRAMADMMVLVVQRGILRYSETMTKIYTNVFTIRLQTSKLNY